MERTKENRFASTTFHDTSPCPYFDDGRMYTIEYLLPGEEESRNFHVFLAQGYRRFGRIFYRNICEHCTACKPVRLDVNRFVPGRSHKRTLRKNRDMRFEVRQGSGMTQEKLSMYKKYIAVKHPDNEHDNAYDPVIYLASIHYGFSHTVEMDYYLGNKLIGVGILDEGRDALSSNYFYYDTDYLQRRPGIFSIIQEILLAKSTGKRYYYLGFLIEENPKMSYKKHFRPHQVLENGRWKDLL